MTGNRVLAEQARTIAADAPAGSLTRKAAGCCAVVFATTKTPTGARKALTDVRILEIRQAALELLDQLTKGKTP